MERWCPRGSLRCCECGKAYCRGCAEKWSRTMVELGVCPDCGEVFEAEGDCWDWE